MAEKSPKRPISGGFEHETAALRLVGRGVRARRRSRGWSQTRLGEEAHVGRAFLCELERGRANPSLAVLARISSALGCAVPELFTTVAHVRTTRTPREARQSWIDAAVILSANSTNGHVLGNKYLEVASEAEVNRCNALAKRFAGRLDAADFTRNGAVDRSLRLIFEAQEKREKLRAALLGGASLTPANAIEEEAEEGRAGVTWD